MSDGTHNAASSAKPSYRRVVSRSSPDPHPSEKRLVAPDQNALATVDHPVPLRAFVELAEHDHAPALVAVAAGHAFALLARHSFDLADYSPAAGLDLLERWAPLAGRVPVYRLSRRRDFDDLPATCALLRPLLDVRQ